MSDSPVTVSVLLALARRTLELPQEDAAALVAALEEYLEAFDRWQSALQGNNPLAPDSPVPAAEREAFRSQVEALEVDHRAVLELAQQNRDRIHTQMGGMRKRAQALKAYIDRYPSRITIAGKREG